MFFVLSINSPKPYINNEVIYDEKVPTINEIKNKILITEPRYVSVMPIVKLRATDAITPITRLKTATFFKF